MTEVWSQALFCTRPATVWKDRDMTIRLKKLEGQRRILGRKGVGAESWVTMEMVA